MAYASLEQFDSMSPNVWSDDITDDMKLEALEEASDEIDNYLRPAYDLPLLVPYDAAIVKANVVISSYNLLFRLGWDPTNASDAMIENQYNKTIAWLDKVAQGRYILSNKQDYSTNVLNRPRVYRR